MPFSGRGKEINYQQMNYTITAFLIAISIKQRAMPMPKGMCD